MTTDTVGGRLRGQFGDRATRFSFLVPLIALVAVQKVFFPAPMGVVLNGALVGGRIALIALGIALIYRANRVINFAQGDLGAVPASLSVMVVLAWGLNYWLGFLIGLGAALLLGLLIETLIIGRFFRAPRLVLTVATIGISQILTGAALLLPRAFGENAFGSRLPQPFGLEFEVGGTIFNATDVLTMIVVPAAFVALALFLTRSSVGIAIVASAERADRAATLGIPVRRLHTVVWVIASVLAYVAMFLRAGAVGLPIGEVLAPTFLVQALAAAVFGRFERLTTIATAAIGLGIVDQSMTFQSGNKPAYNDAVLFVIVLVGLLVVRRSRTGERVDSDASATWQAAREIRPIPRELAALPEVRAVRFGIWAAIGLFVVTLPAWLSNSRLNLATIIVLFAIVAASLVVLTGWAGQVSLGQMAFVGVGAAVGGALTSDHDQDLLVAVLVAGLVGAAAAVVVGYPAIRRRGLTLAVSTLAFALFVASYLLNRTIFEDQLPGRRIGRGTLLWSIELTNDTRFFYVSLAFLGLALAMVVGVRRSRTGRVLVAIRENEKAARAYGVNATRTTLAAFALSGFLAALAGALYVHQQQGLSVEPFLTQRSLDLFSMVVIGGLGSLPGAVLGAVYVRGADFFLPLDWQFLATGAGLLLVLLLLPSGLGGLLADMRDAALRRVATRRGLVVPSLLADVRVEELDEDRSLEHAVAAAKAEAAAGPATKVAAFAGGPAGPADASDPAGAVEPVGPPDASDPTEPAGPADAPSVSGRPPDDPPDPSSNPKAEVKR